MVSKPDDGGPAFPDGDGYTGMSLRDWLAGLAMQGVLSLGDDGGGYESVAARAYHMADVMLAERGKKRT